MAWIEVLTVYHTFLIVHLFDTPKMMLFPRPGTFLTVPNYLLVFLIRLPVGKYWKKRLSFWPIFPLVSMRPTQPCSFPKCGFLVDWHLRSHHAFFLVSNMYNCFSTLGLTDRQMDEPPHSRETPPPHSQHHLTLATATYPLTSPILTPHAVPSARTCSLVPTLLCPAILCGICLLKTRAVPPQNLALMNRWVSRELLFGSQGLCFAWQSV